MSRGEHDTVIVEKHYRMTLDFRVLVGKIDDEVERDGDNLEHAGEHLERQRRLLRALLRDERVLDEFMTYLVTDRVCGHTDSELGKVFGVRKEEKILEPLYSKMGDEDARFFREVSQEGIFWENTEEFDLCFAVDWRRAGLIEIKAERDGDTSSAEMGQLYLRRVTR